MFCVLIICQKLLEGLLDLRDLRVVFSGHVLEIAVKIGFDGKIAHTGILHAYRGWNLCCPPNASLAIGLFLKFNK